MNGQIFIIAAPSGAGKSSLVAALVASDPGIRLSISHTTRAPRAGESDGREYHFVSHDTFQAMQSRGEFLESAEVYGNFYGTSSADIRSSLEQGQDVVLEIDWQGARQVRTLFPEAISIFILPPSLDALRERLLARGKDPLPVIERRLAVAREDLSHENEFDYAIINNEFAEAAKDLAAIVRAARCRRDRQLPRYAALIR
ncbi:MAG: guanylate kinase [Betaproteobacteria bacterium]|nr:guanylate kinase [Betaproteobacteria bacterium]MDE2132586.1 guanylate kinase [Betaproteobacteria bacterium]MDE2211337.1 guanylate kinase [Betaproteobacteria bacterium]MDE2623906.1 guanylate kinase [Betaproteobacteria bacterium]